MGGVRVLAQWDSVGALALAKPLLSRPGGSVVCYGCGEAGHFKRECPKKPAAVYLLGSVEYTCMGTGGGSMYEQGQRGGGRSCDQEVLCGDVLSPEVFHGDVLSPEVLHGDVLSPARWQGREWLPDMPQCSPRDLVCTQRCWEFAEADKAVSDGMAVKGRVRHHIHFWMEEPGCPDGIGMHRLWWKL